MLEGYITIRVTYTYTNWPWFMLYAILNFDEVYIQKPVVTMET